MVLGNVLISPDTRANLGPAGVAELTASLWPVDCQTCGRPLGAQPPALAVDDVTAFAWASLHHQRCRAPGMEQWPGHHPDRSRGIPPVPAGDDADPWLPPRGRTGRGPAHRPDPAAVPRDPGHREGRAAGRRAAARPGRPGQPAVPGRPRRPPGGLPAPVAEHQRQAWRSPLITANMTGREFRLGDVP